MSATLAISGSTVTPTVVQTNYSSLYPAVFDSLEEIAKLPELSECLTTNDNLSKRDFAKIPHSIMRGKINLNDSEPPCDCLIFKTLITNYNDSSPESYLEILIHINSLSPWQYISKQAYKEKSCPDISKQKNMVYTNQLIFDHFKNIIDHKPASQVVILGQFKVYPKTLSDLSDIYYGEGDYKTTESGKPIAKLTPEESCENC